MTTAVTASNSRIRRAAPKADARLETIARKVGEGERLSVADGVTLFETPDIWTVCSLADMVRRRINGDAAYYNINKHINYSNICALSCKFCSFYRKKDQDGAYEFSIDEIREKAREAVEAGATELHIVGGLHPWLKFEYYTSMMRAIHEVAPQIHIKAFTAVEIVHLARITKRSRDGYEGIRSLLIELKEAGLGSLPGGGAEVFDDRVHDEVFRTKIRAAEWLDVHRAAHEIGLNSNATMLYGHVETRAERINHLDLLRRQQDATLRAWAQRQSITLQDEDAVVLYGPDEQYPNDRTPTPQTCETGYFQTIIPLPFFPDASELEHIAAPTGLENLRTLAIARLMLDNFAHVKAFWIMQTLEAAQFQLQNGADDIDGTVVWYDITKVGGTDTHQEVTVRDLERAIREAGLRPIERDTLYRPVVRDGRSWRVRGAD